MAKSKTTFRCSTTNCSYSSPKWLGKCPQCNEFGTLQEVEEVSSVGVKSSGSVVSPVLSARRISQISTTAHHHQPTGIGEFDRVLGGGLTPGGVILLAGEPGCGKSTLTTSVAGAVAARGIKTLIASGEESVEQIALRANRIGVTSDNLYLTSENDLAKVLGHIQDLSPEFLIVDSVQTIASADIESRSGSTSQVSEVATVLTRVAKERNIPLIFIGHVTKDGNIAGPRVVEHLVDVVLYFEGDRDTPLKLLRGVKNRYGAADEIGCFEHTEEGIVEVTDPSGMLLGQRETNVPGVMTSITVEGKRPLPIEIQSLVAPSAIPVPRRAVSGLDTARSVMMQAVLDRYSSITLGNKDIYLATVGGASTKETAVDLATVMSLASAALEIDAHHDAVAIGEVALSGEVRRIPGISRRLAEASRLGFKVAFIPAKSTENISSSLRSSLRLVEISHVGHAVEAVKAWA